MTGEGIVQILWFVGAFTLALSAVAVRRLPVSEIFKMILIWVAIFVSLFVGVSWWQG